MSKLGRHQRTIHLPDEEPWGIPAQPAPAKRDADREPTPVPVPDREPQTLPAAPSRT